MQLQLCMERDKNHWHWQIVKKQPIITNRTYYKKTVPPPDNAQKRWNSLRNSDTNHLKYKALHLQIMTKLLNEIEIIYTILLQNGHSVIFDGILIAVIKRHFRAPSLVKAARRGSIGLYRVSSQMKQRSSLSTPEGTSNLNWKFTEQH